MTVHGVTSPVVLVGEANPYGSDPYYALYPDPPGCAGDRLCRKIMKLDPDDYLQRFVRVNLCPRKWSMKEARANAKELQKEHTRFILFGAKVSKAFDLDFAPFTQGVYQRARVLTLVILPHPSGLNRMWGEINSYQRAHDVLCAAGVL